MAESTDAIGEAFSRTVKKPSGHGEPTINTFLGHLKDTAKDIGLPVEQRIGESIAFALLNREAPIDQRRNSMRNAITTARDSILTQFLPTIGIDGQTIASRSQTISDQLANTMVEAAAIYPKKPEKGDLVEEMLKIINPNKPSLEDKAVSACVGFELFQPYLIDRLLELDFYDPEKLNEQMQDIKRDVSLLKNFYHSTAHAAELATEGTSSISMEELIERMFQIGPIFAKLAQGLNVPQVLAAKIPEKAQAEFVSQIARGMQEGILPPDDKQQQDIAAGLPTGLSYKKIISSASIAHVVETETPGGERRATKIKRPNINQAITDNQDTFNLAARVYARYIDEHIEGTQMGDNKQRVKELLPFVLNTFVADLRQELDFPAEAKSQKEFSKIFAHDKGIHVPEIDDEFTDDEHITMEYVEGTRLENLPAHASHLKNLFKIPLLSWRSRLLHGDMHGGNVKGRGDGSLVLYDYGKSVELSQDLIKNLGQFLYAIARQNPDAIAKAYVKIQSSDHNQITENEARIVAQEVLDSLPESGEQKETRLKKAKKAFSRTSKGLATTMVIRHQSTMDTDYVTVLQTAIRYGSIVATEMSKPEYQDKKIRRKALRQSIAGAIKEVYFTRSKEGSE